MKKKSWNKLFLELVSDKPVAFSPTLARIGGSAIAGLFMSQLLYWWDKGSKKDWIYKTIEEFGQETCLTRSEQDRAIASWVRLGVLKKKRVGVPPKRHFQVNLSALGNLAKRADQFVKERDSKRSDKQNITESTAENTPEISRIYNTGRVPNTRTEDYQNI